MYSFGPIVATPFVPVVAQPVSIAVAAAQRTHTDAQIGFIAATILTRGNVRRCYPASRGRSMSLPHQISGI